MTGSPPKISSPSGAYRRGAQAAKYVATVSPELQAQARLQARGNIARGSLSFFDMGWDDFRADTLMSGVTLD